MNIKYFHFFIIIFITFIIFIILNNYLKFKKNKLLEKFMNNNKYNIYVFWTGDNEMNEIRLNSIEKLKEISECNIILITNKNLKEYILPFVPLHPSYEYLSFTHRSDYLRTYFMHFYGGGYSDIKCTTGSWKSSFDELYNSNNFWINGYTEVKDGVAYEPLKNNYNELIGNGAYICKPKTLLTTEWYNSMILLLDEKLEKLKEFPATFPQDCLEVSNGKYPIKWTEMLGDIFHKVCYKYKEKLLHTLPISIFQNYR